MIGLLRRHNEARRMRYRHPDWVFAYPSIQISSLAACEAALVDHYRPAMQEFLGSRVELMTGRWLTEPERELAAFLKQGL